MIVLLGFHIKNIKLKKFWFLLMIQKMTLQNLQIQLTIKILEFIVKEN